MFRIAEDVPADPVAPVAPVAPVLPVEPVAPVAPVEPFAPCVPLLRSHDVVPVALMTELGHVLGWVGHAAMVIFCARTPLQVTLLVVQFSVNVCVVLFCTATLH